MYGQAMRRLTLALVMTLFAAACVQPIQPTPTPAPPSPTPFISPTPPPTVEPVLPTNNISAWIQQNFGVGVQTLQLFTQFEVGPDTMVGYTFLNPGGQTCVGWALTTLDGSTVWNADFRCAQASTTVVGSSVLALTNNEFYVAVFGYVDPATIPNANAMAAVFPNGESVNTFLTQNSFVQLRQGLDFPTRVVIIDAGGNNLAEPTLQ